MDEHIVNEGRPADFDARFPNWDRDTRAYIEGMAALGPGQGHHNNCDHAEGICSWPARTERTS